MTRIVCALTVVWSLLGSSACGPSVAYSSLKDSTGSAKAADQVQIVMEGAQPGCRADPIGVVQGKSWLSGYTPGSPGESIRVMQVEAARHGAHGVMKIKCHDAEDVGESPYQCVGTAYVCVARLP